MVELHIYGCNSMKFSQSINYKKKKQYYTAIIISYNYPYRAKRNYHTFPKYYI